MSLLKDRINIKGENPDPSHPDITDDELWALCNCSPIFERHLLRLRLFPTYCWNIPVADPGAARTALEKVSRPEADKRWLDEVRADDPDESFRRYCDALWQFHVVPDRLPSYEAWIGHECVSDPVSEAGNAAYIWQQQFGQSEVATALRAARAALVLGCETRFKAEMKVLIWAMTANFVEATTPTTIERLSVESLKAIRANELGEVQRKIAMFLDSKRSESKLRKNAESILQRQPKDHSGLFDMSILEYLARFQESVYTMMPTNTTIHRGASPSLPKSRPPPRSSRRYLYKLTNLAADTGPDSIEGMAGELFKNLDTFLLTRQESVSSEIYNWRNKQVASWREILDERGDRRWGLAQDISENLEVVQDSAGNPVPLENLPDGTPDSS
ncbi:hypothetical protein B0T14DRAFT_572059 [Immersiella caudata]|uniref:Uncharacterized protein n=1 Tax=Immersiella caudata TaxID=314043 RepID=A0AA39TM29_9PEZI|nr:hypothetical protein B0T14DRAFT_572059 [Immersiella caudata]